MVDIRDGRAPRLALQTDRLTLLPVTAVLARAALDDRPALEKLVGVNVSSKWPADLRPLFPMYSENRSIAADGEAGWGPWVTLDVSVGELVGDVGFKGSPSVVGEVELGYSTVVDFRGRGYATEAASRLVEWALTHANVTAVVAESEQDNTASARVLSKLGMEQTGQRGSLTLWRIERLD